MRPQVRILSSRPLNVQVVSFGWRLFCLHREGEICGIRCWFTSYMGRGEFFRLRRSAKWPPCLFLRAKVVRRLTRRSDIGPPCWISLSASPAGSRFASAGEKSHLFLDIAVFTHIELSFAPFGLLCWKKFGDFFQKVLTRERILRIIFLVTTGCGTVW